VAAFTDSPVKIAEVAVTATGAYELPLSGRQVEKLDPDAAAVRCKATLGGTAPSITWFLPDVGRVSGGCVPCESNDVPVVLVVSHHPIQSNRDSRRACILAPRSALSLR
jgi:hypothetical protein